MRIMITLSAKRAAYGGFFVAMALMFSYLETLIPLNYFIHIPGFKLGFSNISVLLAIFYLGTFDAFLISLCKIVLTAILFGNPTSFLFSLGGGILSFLFLLIAKYVIKEKISYIGISVASAALHNVGQVMVACLIFKDFSVMWYLEWLLPVSVITGIITGAVAVTFRKITEKKYVF